MKGCALSQQINHRIAFIGTRGHHGTMLSQLATAAPMTLVGASPGGDSAEAIVKFAREGNLACPVFESVDQLLDETHPTICVVCGPFERHAEHTVSAIRRGIHCITEKPVAVTESQLEELEGAVKANPRVELAGMMFSRFDPGFFHAKQMIDSGAIGEIRLVNARKAYKLGKRAGFYTARDTYGGTIPWVGSHAIDWTMWFIGNAPRHVYATHSARHNSANGTMERSAACLLEFDHEITATASIDVFRPEAAPSHGDDWIRVVGTTGTMEVRNEKIEIVDANGARAITPPAAPRNFLQTFVGQIACTVPAVIDAKQTIDLTRTLLAARRSADQHRRIEIG